MTMIIIKLKEKKAAVIRAAILVLFSIALAWAIAFLAGINPILIIYPVTGVALYIAFLYFLMNQKNRFKRFCDIYDNPDIKHKPKVMFYSMIKYLAVIYLLFTVPYGIAVFLVLPALIPVYLVVLPGIAGYIKLWKHHGYSVPLLLFMTGVVITAAIMLSPFVRTGVWTVIKAYLAIPQLFL